MHVEWAKKASSRIFAFLVRARRAVLNSSSQLRAQYSMSTMFDGVALTATG